MENARYYYIQNTVNPQDSEPTGDKWYQLDIEGIPPNFVIWKCYTYEEPNGSQIGLTHAAFKGWLNENKV
jgi:hypothetical protein